MYCVSMKVAELGMRAVWVKMSCCCCCAKNCFYRVFDEYFTYFTRGLFSCFAESGILVSLLLTVREKTSACVSSH